MEELNHRMENLLHGNLRWLAGSATAMHHEFS